MEPVSAKTSIVAIIRDEHQLTGASPTTWNCACGYQGRKLPGAAVTRLLAEHQADFVEDLFITLTGRIVEFLSDYDLAVVASALSSPEEPNPERDETCIDIASVMLNAPEGRRDEVLATLREILSEKAEGAQS